MKTTTPGDHLVKALALTLVTSKRLLVQVDAASARTAGTSSRVRGLVPLQRRGYDDL